MTATSTALPGKEHVSRADIEAKLRELRGEVEATREASKGLAIAAGAAAAVALVAVVYLLGRRKGRRRTTVVEVRRV